MSLFVKATSKIRTVLHRLILGRLGFGKRVSKQVWESQFGGGMWDYLYSKEEEAHYLAIIDFYERFSNKGTILDIGCGNGVLYHYLNTKTGLPANKYQGIDLSKNAVAAAVQNFPGVAFSQVDFEHQNVVGKFDVIIFNETLYYFNRPLKTLGKCVLQNLKPGGCFILSMCDYANHEIIWEKIAASYQTLLEEEVKNEKNQKWKIKLLQPLAQKVSE